MVEIGAKPCQFFRIAEVRGLGDLVIRGGEDTIGKIRAVIAVAEVRAERLGAIIALFVIVLTFGFGVGVAGACLSE